MNIRLALGALVGALPFVLSFPAPAQQPAPTSGAPRALPTDVQAWKGDFDGMVERRVIRVLVPYSRTLYFNDKGRERGVTADLVRNFEQYINKKYVKTLGKRPITVVMIPTTRDKILQWIADGRGDIAAGNLTVTDERAKIVDFVAPPDQTVSEVVVTGPKSPAIATAEELSGKTVHVRKASSYYESLVQLNERLKKAGRPAANLALVPDALEDEDMMEMLNIGLFEAIVVDDWKAKIWAQALPKIKVNEGAVVRAGGVVGWAIRKDSPKLKEIAGEYYANAVKKQGLVNIVMKQASGRVKQFRNPAGTSAETKRFEETLALFRKYGEKYGFDPLMLAAQGYQESQLDQNAKSQVGAIGVMQLMPATGAELKVGDVRLTEPNIHAGAKYMDQLMTKYFPDAKFSEMDRALFAFAAYNAGPGRIATMRREAAKRGLDPDKWFNNVEIVTAEKVGIETTTYVRNIYKYYAAYRLMLDREAEQKKAREQASGGRKG